MIEYDEGYEAFEEGLDLKDNPYSDVYQPEKFEEWDEGFLDAADKEENKEKLE